MFTGIVEEIGTVKGIKKSQGSEFGTLEIECKTVLEGTRLGDSIAVNGTCLTADELGKNTFTAHVMGETFNKTNLGNLNPGDKVNLERALTLSSRLGGHIVSGHVDGTGVIADVEAKPDGTWFTIKADNEILNHIVNKGSITIDGISLTIAELTDEYFKVSIIPHTLKNTILSLKNPGSTVNLENDVIGKYVERFVKINMQSSENKEKKSNITMEFLMENGF